MGRPSSTEWTRDQIASRILSGETLVIYNGTLLRIPQFWLDAHPGGALAILHFVGRDATDEVDAFHSAEALKRLNAYSIGTVETSEEGWEPMLPPLASGWVRKGLSWHNEAERIGSDEDSHFHSTSQVLLVKRHENFTESAPDIATINPPPTTLSLKVQTQHSIAYKALHKRIVEAGLYQCRYITGYGPEVARYLSFMLLSAFAYSRGWFLTSSLFLGFLWHQLVFTAHDLGHVGVTHNWTIDRLLGILIADFMGGLSIGWWTEVRLRYFMWPQNKIFITIFSES
jgi:delta8-fatty-acid desaturase